MSDAHAALQSAYAEWRRLAQAEGSGIRAGNWAFVAQCQQALRLLRETIDRLRAEGSSTPGTASRPVNQTWRGTVLELIELQRQNLLSLQKRRDRLATEVEHLTRADRNLRSIQRSYSAPAPSGWSSYS